MKAKPTVPDLTADLKRTRSRGLLRLVLVARVVASFATAFLLVRAPPTFVGLGLPFIVFAFGDGTFAIVMASVAFNMRLLRGKFVAAALFDGIVLLAVSVTLLMGSGIPDSRVFLALHMGIAVTCFSLVGVVRLFVARRFYRRLVGNVLSVGLVIMGLASAALGTAELFMPPNAAVAKQFLLAAVVLQGVALLIPAISTWPAPPTLQNR